MDKVIPAYYACYLLRSTVRHQSLYVGSTPHPRRRLRQHNGAAAGGAVKTSRDTLRPWEMTCLVSGFPSKIAALQFEWAWQNAHLTRHLSADDRLTQAKSTVRISPKTGRVRKRPAKPRLSLSDRLASLHLLLRASSFERWPLHVTFYAEDVHRVWSKWTSQQVEKLRPGISVSLDESAQHASINDAFMTPKENSGIHGIDVTYRSLKPHFLKSKEMLEKAEWLNCSVCHEGLPASGAATLVCPHEGCKAMSHMECLSSAFISAGRDEDALIPTTGACPGCGKQLQWADLVKELSLRMRGATQIDALFKARGRRKAAASVEDDESDISSEEDRPERLENPTDADDWFELPESSDDEVPEPVVRSDPTPLSKVRRFEASTPIPKSERVVEDSDWDDAMVLT